MMWFAERNTVNFNMLHHRSKITPFWTSLLYPCFRQTNPYSNHGGSGDNVDDYDNDKCRRNGEIGDDDGGGDDDDVADDTCDENIDNDVNGNGDGDCGGSGNYDYDNHLYDDDDDDDDNDNNIMMK